MAEDFLSEMGMSKEEQHAATMQAANVPVSDFEGYFPLYKTSGRAASLLSKALFESRMRREMPEMKGE